jgi:hypothetical protein
VLEAGGFAAGVLVVHSVTLAGIALGGAALLGAVFALASRG